MKLTNTTLGKYLSWYCFFDEDKPMEEVVETIGSYGFADFWHIDAPVFVQTHWDNPIVVIECEKSNTNSGEHDVAIVCDDFILPMTSIDYAFTPEEESKVV